VATVAEKIRQQNEEIAAAAAENINTGAEEPKWSYMHQMLPWSGYLSKQNVLFDMLRPYKLLASPIVMWASIMWLNCLTWLVAIAITTSQIFSAPPYNFNVTQVGAINMAGFIGSLIGTFASQYLSDRIATYMARKNKGVYEPEFRLIIIIPYLLLAVPGLCAFGASVTFQEPWPVPVILGFGMFTLGTQLGATGVITYINDCYRDRAAEALAGPVAVKNLFTFGMTFYINVCHSQNTLTLELDFPGWPFEGVRHNCWPSSGHRVVDGSHVNIRILDESDCRYHYGKRVRSWNHRHAL